MNKQQIGVLNKRFTEIQRLLAAGQFELAIAQARSLQSEPSVRVAAQSMEAFALASIGQKAAALDVLKQMPDVGQIRLVEVLVMVGSAWFRLELPNKAIEYFMGAVALEPQHALANARLGACLLATGEHGKAFPYLLAAQLAMPQSAGAALNLARAYLRQAQPEKALDILSKPFADEDQESNLVLLTRLEALYALDRNEEAQALIDRQEKPSSINGTEALVNLLANRGQHDDAYAVLQRALEHFPDSIELLSLAAELAQVRGRYGEAARALRQALEHQPDSAALWAQLASLSGKRLSIDDAVEAADKALALTEGKTGLVRAQAVAAKAHVLEESGDYAGAEKLWREALDLSPNFPRAMTGLGHLLMQLGRVDEATEIFERLKSVAPMLGWSQLINARQVPEDPDVLEKMEASARRPSMEGPVRAHMLFTLASAWEKKGDYDKAWALAMQANAATKPLLPYKPDDHRARVEREIARFSRAFMDSRKAYGSQSKVPVFVLGMPRSGTTLVEQILGSHSQVFGAGELSLIPQQIQKLEAWEAKLGSGRHYPECVDDMTQDESVRFAEKLLAELQAYAPNAQRVVDKLPHNFEHVGLIKLLFPNAKILHLKREPRDVAMSNFFIDYGAKFGGMGFAYDLTWIGEQLVDHARLMQHWHAVFPGQILEVDYDALVEDVEGWAHRIIDYLDLPWEPGVLAFQSLERAVKTASVWQVRQPVYTTSKAKWKRYAAHLQPLESALAAVPEMPEPLEVPERVPGLFLTAMARLNQGDAPGAELLFGEIQTLYPRHAAAAHFQGAACYQQGKLDEASKLMTKSVRLHRGHRAWLENLLKVEMARQDTERVARLRRVLDGLADEKEMLLPEELT